MRRSDSSIARLLLKDAAGDPRCIVVRQSVQSVIEAYRKAFDQQSVLWESARVCVVE